MHKAIKTSLTAALLCFAGSLGSLLYASYLEGGKAGGDGWAGIEWLFYRAVLFLLAVASLAFALLVWATRRSAGRGSDANV